MKIRLWFTGLLIMAVFSVAYVNAAPVMLVNDDFNKEATGAKPANYDVIETGGKVSIAAVPSATDKSIFLDDPGANNIRVTRSFAPQTGIVTVQMAFMQTSLGSTAKAIRLLEKDTGVTAVHIETLKPAMFSLKNADGTFTMADFYKENVWSIISIVADIPNKKADIYINGVKKLAGVAFMAPVANIAAFDSYTPGSSAKGHYIDNVKVYAGQYDATQLPAIPVSVAPPPASVPIAAITPTPTPTPVPTPAPTPATPHWLISDLKVLDAKNAAAWSIQPNLQIGDIQFGDRVFTVVKLPAAYAGYDWIRTSADSKFFTGDVLVTFKLKQKADIFVGMDDRVAVKPAWLKDWVDTKDDIVNSDPNVVSFSLYKKSFPADATVTLGENGQSKTCIQYMIIVKGPKKPKPVKTPTVSTQPGATPAKVAWNRALSMDPKWYSSEEAIRIADNILLYQRDTGGWYKYTDASENSTDMAAALTEAQKAAVQNDKRLGDATIDNNATTTQLRYLAKVYTATKLPRLMLAYNRGLDFIFKIQYDNGGWAQESNAAGTYHAYITYNDNAMTNVLNLLLDIEQGKHPDYKFTDKAYLAKTKTSIEKGIDCILKTQIKAAGKLTAWCAQHDEKTLAPAPARAYELPSISGQESVGVVRFLMRIEKPKPEVIAAIQAAITWFNEVKIVGIQEVQKADPTKPKGWDIVIIQNPTAPPLWARFYEIGTNRPFFVGRDGIKRYNLAEIEYERRTGYSYYTTAPGPLLEYDYPTWQKKWDNKVNVLKK